MLTPTVVVLDISLVFTANDVPLVTWLGTEYSVVSVLLGLFSVVVSLTLSVTWLVLLMFEDGNRVVLISEVMNGEVKMNMLLVVKLLVGVLIVVTCNEVVLLVEFCISPVEILVAFTCFVSVRALVSVIAVEVIDAEVAISLLVCRT